MDLRIIYSEFNFKIYEFQFEVYENVWRRMNCAIWMEAK